MALAEIDMKIAGARTKEERVYLRKEKEIISRYLNQKISRHNTSSHGDTMSILDNNRSISPK
jgi:hypothetical protein